MSNEKDDDDGDGDDDGNGDGDVNSDGDDDGMRDHAMGLAMMTDGESEGGGCLMVNNEVCRNIGGCSGRGMTASVRASLLSAFRAIEIFHKIVVKLTAASLERIAR